MFMDLSSMEFSKLHHASLSPTFRVHTHTWCSFDFIVQFKTAECIFFLNSLFVYSSCAVNSNQKLSKLGFIS